MQANLDDAKGEAARLRPIADRAPDLERNVARLTEQYGLYFLTYGGTIAILTGRP